MSEVEVKIKTSRKNILSLEIKKQRLIELAHSTLNHPNHKDSLKKLMIALNISKQKIINAYVYYDMDIYAYGNEIFEPMVMRLVLHLHNLLEGSWHQEIQKIIRDCIQLAQPNTIIDVGFGGPTLYVQQALQYNHPKITLGDYCKSALIFAKTLLNQWDSTWKNTITLKKIDMEKNNFVGKFDLYLFQDSIEHTKDPTSYLSKQVKFSPKHSKFLLAIPIGPIIPAHYMAWHNISEATNWLAQCGLKILKKRIAYVNPAIDLYADKFNFKNSNFIVLCDKLI